MLDISIEEKLRAYVGEMLIVGFRGFEVNPGDPVARDIQKNHLGGVILFDWDAVNKKYIRNIQNPEQVIKLATQLKALTSKTLLISIDQEGGLVQRFKPRWGFPDFPSAEGLAKASAKDGNIIYNTSKKMAGVLKAHGVNFNFAPVADVNVNPANPVLGIHHRVFSANPIEVTNMSQQFIDGHRAENVLTSIKHFPGHGSSTTDSHLGFADVSTTWTPDELIPFQKMIEDNRVDTIMVSHVLNSNIDPELPASLSYKTMTTLLREKMGYQGVIVTDDLQMGAIAQNYTVEKAIVLTIQGGADILIFGNTLIYDADLVPKIQAVVLKAVANGDLTLERLEKSYKRIQTLKQTLK